MVTVQLGGQWRDPNFQALKCLPARPQLSCPIRRDVRSRTLNSSQKMLGQCQLRNAKQHKKGPAPRQPWAYVAMSLAVRIERHHKPRFDRPPSTRFEARCMPCRADIRGIVATTRFLAHPDQAHRLCRTPWHARSTIQGKPFGTVVAVKAA